MSVLKAARRSSMVWRVELLTAPTILLMDAAVAGSDDSRRARGTVVYITPKSTRAVRPCRLTIRPVVVCPLMRTVSPACKAFDTGFEDVGTSDEGCEMVAFFALRSRLRCCRCLICSILRAIRSSSSGSRLSISSLKDSSSRRISLVRSFSACVSRMVRIVCSILALESLSYWEASSRAWLMMSRFCV